MTPKTAIEFERERMLSELRRREQEVSPALYKRWNPAILLAHGIIYRDAVTMLHQADVFPQAGDQCLEVGYGTRGWLPQLLDWGVRETDLHGLELDAISARKAQETLPMADLRVGNAVSLPWPDNSFQLVMTFTLFTSILDAEVRQLAAQEITRVLAPGGALLWHDFAVNNPRNPNVRKISARELRALFPSLQGHIKRNELAPPLARAIAPRSWVLATMLEKLPFLCTHLLAVLTKSH